MRWRRHRGRRIPACGGSTTDRYGGAGRVVELTVDEEPSVGSVLDVLHDGCARAILEATSQEPMTAKALERHCDASRTTVYRRLEQLEELDLVKEQTRPRPDGHHDTLYVATLDECRLRLRDGRFTVELSRGNDAVDRLTDLWERF
jgi:DNA-binding HxlR family transcriptional regulator